jgi:hypothetical protein
VTSLQPIGRDDDVGVDETDHGRLRRLLSGTPSRAASPVLPVPYQAQVRERLLEIFDNRSGRITRAVIDDDNLEGQ